MDVTLFPEYGADKAHRAAHKQRMADAQGALFDVPDDIDYVVNDPDQLTLVEPPRCARCGHFVTEHGRFYSRSWSDHCRAKGCKCPWPQRPDGDLA